jgi:rhodanese-related sulfurtransferase
MFSTFGGKAAQAKLTAATAAAKLTAAEITVLDVREANEVAASGTALGGVHIPLALLPMKANPQSPDHDARLDPSRPVAVFCAVGGRAGMAVQTLQGLGYDAHNIGGFSDWEAAGGPVTH